MEVARAAKIAVFADGCGFGGIAGSLVDGDERADAFAVQSADLDRAGGCGLGMRRGDCPVKLEHAETCSEALFQMRTAGENGYDKPVSLRPDGGAPAPELLRRPRPDEIYVFTPQEVAALGINRRLQSTQRLVSPPAAAGSRKVSKPLPDNAESLAKAFVLGLILSGSLPSEDLLELSQNAYADTVQFYGKQITRQEVLQDKKQYAER